eukprot:scaffold1970_cov114-Isochrysis_galbana.AAC.8
MALTRSRLHKVRENAFNINSLYPRALRMASAARYGLGWATGSVQVPVALHRVPQTLWWAQLCGAQGTAL